MGDNEDMSQQPFAGVAETHSGVVYFAGDRAYKLKKPVRLPFLDFSTRAARAAACARETELNRRFAPDVYLGVAEVRDPAGEICDHLVVMRRMPDNRRLSSLIRAHEPVGPVVRQIAKMVAAQHAAAERSPQISEQGSRDATRRRWQDNIGELRAAHGDLIDDADIDEISHLADRFLTGREPLFDTRCRAGHVLDGHGDLLADDIFCLDDGPRILDCLDFDDRLRWLDGLDDVAFLAMDLDRLGAPELAERFTRWYSDFSGDPAPSSLRHHYVAYRAVVRAKVSCVRAHQGDPTAPGEAHRLIAAAIRHLRAGAVTLVLVGGPPGTGKSALTGAIADKLGFSVLNSDEIRKELAGIPPQQRAATALDAGIYTRQWTDRTYEEMLIRAAKLLALGESVVLDATWTSADHRNLAAEVASHSAADLVQLRCTAAPQVITSRIASRVGGVSDATPAVAAQLAASQAPWPDAVVVDTSGEPGLADPVDLALRSIRPHGPEHVWRPARSYMPPG